MGDSAEFEKLTILEARLAAALDRIARGVTVTPPPPPMPDPGVTTAALEDAQARAATAEATAAQWAERANLLKAQLEQAKSAAGDTDTVLAQAAASEAAREAYEETARRDIAERDARIGELEAALALRDPLDATRAGGEIDRAAIERELLVVEHYFSEFQTERDRAIAAFREGTGTREEVLALQRQLTTLQEKRVRAETARDHLAARLVEAAPGRDASDDRILALRTELAGLRVVRDDLVSQLAAANRDTVAAAGDSAAIEALATELLALQDMRAADAAELDRIVADLGAVEAGGQANAGR